MMYQRKICMLLLVSTAVMNAMDKQSSEVSITENHEGSGVLVRLFGNQSMADKASVGMQLFGTAAVFAAVHYLKDNPTIASVGGYANLTHKDMNTITLVSGGLLGLGLLGSEKLSNVAKSLSWRVPVYGLLIAGIYSRSFEQLTGMVPFIGSALAQDNKVAKGLLLIGGGVLLQPVLDRIGEKAERYFLADDPEEAC